MFSWFRKKKPKFKISRLPTDNPALLLEVDSDGNIEITASWPTPSKKEEALDVINRMTGLIALANAGKLIGPMQYAVATYGSNHGETETAQGILISLQNILGQVKKSAEGPIVKPSQAFTMENNG